MIDEELLVEFGAKKIIFKKGDIIFSEGEPANNYYQISSGQVKMTNYSEEGKEFTQGIFDSFQSFGEPPLLADINYPANAEALCDTIIIQLHKSKFLDLLTKFPEIHLKLTQTLAKRLYYKAIMVSEISNYDAEHRIIRIIDYLKYEVHKKKEDFSFKVPLTRQQIADLTGLRVETVIRAIKSLQKKEALFIKERKVYR
ncbi:Crp/Fnr family transcriptional regulator [Zunongwangia sp.]|uniref:Crp/Fnr family transcriptional regulator n=1 Tax=Zunongwangia sp. TaxID=1965325 RepID=UPI003AA7D5C5